MTTNTAALFLPPSWLGLLRQIAHLSEFGGSVQVITGPAGSGKTALLGHLAAEWDIPPVLISIEQGVPIERFYFSLLEQAGLYPSPNADLGELMVLFRQFAEAQLKSQKRTIVAVDDAHLLEDAQLAALISVLQGHEEAGFGLHFLLFGKPGLAERIDQMPLVDISVHDAELPELSPSEVRSWLDERLDGTLIAGWRDGQVQQLWSDTHGRPGTILQHLQASTAAHPEKESNHTKPSIELGMPWGHIAAVAVLFLVLIWAFWARGPDLEAVPRAELAEAPLSQPPLVKAKEPQLDLDLKDKAVSVDEPVFEPVARVSARSKLPKPSKPPEPKRPPAPKAPKAIVQEATSPSKSKPVKVAPASDPITLDEKRLMGLPKDGYVLQIMASSQRANLLDYRSLQKNVDTLSVYRLMRNDRVLYVLVEGVYKNQATAKAAIPKLPKIQQQGGPWPKPIARVQSEISEAQKAIK